MQYELIVATAKKKLKNPPLSKGKFKNSVCIDINKVLLQ